MAAFGMLLVSTDSLFIRAADFDSWTIACLFGIASTISLGLVHLRSATESPLAIARRAPGPLAAVAGLGAISQIAFTTAVNHTAVSNVVVIVAAAPVVAAVLAWATLGERADRQVVVAIVLSGVGIGVVVGGSLGTPTLGGDLLAVVAIVAFSVAMIFWRRHPDLDRPLALAAGSFTMVLLTAPLASIGDAPGRVFVAAGLMGVLFNPLGRMSYANAPRFAPVAEVALFTPVETIAATLWAWWFFSEQPSWPTVVGGVIVIASVLFGTVGRRIAR